MNTKNVTTILIGIVLLSNCQERITYELPIELESIPPSEIGVTVHTFYPDTIRTEREDIYVFKDLIDFNNFKPEKHSWTINRFDVNDSLMRSEYYFENQNTPYLLIDYSYSPYKNFTQYALNKEGDTSQIEQVYYGLNGIEKRLIQNQRDSSVITQYYFYRGDLLDSMAMTISVSQQESTYHFEKRHYTKDGKMSYASFNNQDVDYLIDKLNFKWSSDTIRHVIVSPENDTLGVEKYKEGTLTESIYYNFYDTLKTKFNIDGKPIRKIVLDGETSIELIQYEKARTLKFTYVK